jgi:hypothetical protein
MVTPERSTWHSSAYVARTHLFDMPACDATRPRVCRKMADKTQDEQKRLREEYEKQMPNCDDKQGEGDGEDDEDKPPPMMDPTVIGRIVWLRPSNKFAIMYGAHEKDLIREGVQARAPRIVVLSSCCMCDV